MRALLFLIVTIGCLPRLAGQGKTVPAAADSLLAKADAWFAAANKDDLFIKDERAQRFVDGILAELLAASGYDPAPFSVHLRNSLTINAAMYPNGNMVLTSGLLLRLNAREELAMVMGHELAHYLLEHFKDTVPADIYEADLQSVLHEYQADSMGAEMIVAAGMPAVAGAFAIEKLPVKAGRLVLSTFFGKIYKGAERMSHPPTPRRVEQLRQQYALSGDTVFVSTSPYHSQLTSIREGARWDMLLDEQFRFNNTIQIITIDSLLDNISGADSTDYYGYLRLQQGEAILRLMRSGNMNASADMKYGIAHTTYRNNNLEAERTYYTWTLKSMGKSSLVEVHRVFGPVLTRTVRELKALPDYATEALRLEGLYLEHLGKYSAARKVFAEYFSKNPTHPSRRYARALADRMPKKDRKKSKF